MEQLELGFFDLGSLVNELNSRLEGEQGSLELGDFVGKEPRKNPFLYPLAKGYDEGDKQRFFVGKYPLFIVSGEDSSVSEESEDIPGSMRLAFLGADREKIGYIFVEKGYIHAENPFGGEQYETIRMRVKQPLRLKGGLVLPNSSIKIYRADDERPELSNGHELRRDHMRRIHLWWERTDLSSILPTEWFGQNKFRAYAPESRKYG